ncbi:MAG: tRNA 2-thiouridine(34) synthase MnmA [Desulfurivibrionaceae bacterium]
MNHDIVLAVSGGVDSAMSAALLREQGFRVKPLFFRLGLTDQDEQQARAENIGERLGLVTEVIDLELAFREKVLDYFCRSYYQGLTPNPCVVCNPYIKFAALLQEADLRGCRWLASGHYARITAGKEGASLHRALDEKKDQSYFLCGLSQEQLSRTVFPLGTWIKEEVRSQAVTAGLADLTGSESQDVCFLKNSGVGEFLRNFCSEAGDRMREGDIVDRCGNVLGRHSGIFSYTVGQRRGLGIPDSTPYYVLAVDPGTNRIIAGKEEELQRSACRVAGLNWLRGYPPELPATLQVRIRYRHPGASARVTGAGDGVRVEFQTPQRAVTPGQFAVFYDETEVLGGGVIQGEREVAIEDREKKR